MAKEFSLSPFIIEMYLQFILGIRHFHMYIQKHSVIYFNSRNLCCVWSSFIFS